MSVLDGLLSPLLTQTANARGSYLAGQKAEQDKQLQEAFARIQLQRQASNDAVETALKKAQTWKDLQPPVPNNVYLPTVGPNGETVYGVAKSKGDATITPTTTQKPKPSEPNVVTVDATGNRTYTQRSKAVGMAAPEPPKPSEPMEVTVNPDGSRVYTPRSQSAGQAAPMPAGQAGSSSGAQVPVADMEDRLREVEQHAQELGRGEWNITKPMQVREGTEYGTAHDAAKGDVSLKKLGTQLALSTVNVGGTDYPKYQTMMNSYRALGDDVAKVFKGRQNEEAVLREVALAQLTPEDYQNPAQIEQKLSRLRNVVALAKLNNPEQAPLSHVAPSGGSPSKTAPARRSTDAVSDADFKAGAAALTAAGKPPKTDAEVEAYVRSQRGKP